LRQRFLRFCRLLANHWQANQDKSQRDCFHAEHL
jgi:hypothetical protein